MICPCSPLWAHLPLPYPLSAPCSSLFFREVCPVPLPIVRITYSIFCSPPQTTRRAGLPLSYCLLSPSTCLFNSAARMSAGTFRTYTEGYGWSLEERSKSWTDPSPLWAETIQVCPLTQSPQGLSRGQGSSQCSRVQECHLPRSRAPWCWTLWAQGQAHHPGKVRGLGAGGGSIQTTFENFQQAPEVIPRRLLPKAQRSQGRRAASNCPYSPLGARQ